jgi:hypothetical protein
VDGPVATWAWSRSAIWIAALLVVAWFPTPDRAPAKQLTDPTLHDVGAAVDVWARWDSAFFLRIAEHGYASAEGAAAFYPLYPATVGVLGRFLNGHFVVAGVLVSIAATLAAFLLLARLGSLLIGVDATQRAILYVAVFPMALYLQAVYSEALFLFLSVAAFVLAERGRLLRAAAVGGLALLTRPVGFALLPALFVIAWRKGDRRDAIAMLIVPIAIFALFPLSLWLDIGRPLAFLDSEQVWQRELSPLGPLDGLWEGTHAALAGVAQLLVGSDTRVFWDHPALSDVDPTYVAVQNIALFAYLLLFLGLTAVAWRRVGLPYGLYAVASLAIPLSTGREAWPLQSLPRFGLVVFPLFLALALVTKRQTTHEIVIAVSAMLLGISIVQWVLYQWVA